MLEAQLVESQGFQFRENDLQTELHRKTNMVEDLQRQLSSYDDIYAKNPPSGHPLLERPAWQGVPVHVEEVASGSGNDVQAMIAQA
eukprot:15037794-Heterocapsa_arctica.AAC.1